MALLPFEIARLEGTGLNPSEVAARVFDICSLDTDPVPVAVETRVHHKVISAQLLLVIQDTTSAMQQSAFRIATATSLRGYLMAKQELGTRHILTLDMSYLHASTLFYTIANVEGYAKQSGLLRATYSFAFHILEDMISMRGWNHVQTVGIAAIVASLANIVCQEDVGCDKEATRGCAERLAKMACETARRNGFTEWVPLACRNPILWDSFDAFANRAARMEAIRTAKAKLAVSPTRAQKYRDALKQGRRRSLSPTDADGGPRPVPHIVRYRRKVAASAVRS